MDYVSSGAVGAIVKQIKDLQKNPAEGITVRLLFFCAGEALTRKDALFLLDAKEREREREIVSDVLVSLPLFDVVFCPTLLFSLTLRANDALLLFF